MAGGEEAVAVASCCLKCCCKQFNQYIQYILEAEKNVKDLRIEVRKLAAVRMDVEKEVEAAEQRGNRPAAAANWVARSKALDGAAQKVLSDHDAMCLPCLNLWSRYNIGKRAPRQLRKARGLIEEKPNLEEAALTTPAREIGGLHFQEKQIETTVVGMDPYLEKALEYISGATVGVIGICGMGGVGKTTLLRKIHGEFLPGKVRRKEFDKVVWAVVYKKSTTAVDEMESDVARLQNDIAKQLGLELDKEPADDKCSKEVLEQRALPIYEYLSNKSFLLLLDDLWRPLELRSIGVPTAGGGVDSQSQRKKHKLVLTSRSKTVCSQMQAAPGLISVHCLNEDDAWRLFEFNATNQTIASHQAIRKLAREVMVECQGLPLALNTIGKALSSKSGDPHPWRDALRKLKEARHVEIPGMEAANAAMLHRLKISYDCLPSQRDKDCLLSCCLWPEDYSIDKAKLTECWLGLGIITSSSDHIDTGMSIITSLEQVHLLEPGDDEATEVKMHDTIRDMSLWISSDCGKMKSKWLVKAGVGMKTAQRVVEQLQEVSAATERVSLMGNLIEELPSAVPHLPAAKAFMLQRNEALRVIPASFLLSAPALTYLDLSNTGVQEVPGEISSLHGLEYLNLSESHIKKLPNELSSLTKLRYLLAATIWLTTLPYGIISNLKQLQTLDVFGSQYATWAWDSENDKCACIDEFEAKATSLKWLGITLCSVEVLRKLAMCNNVRTRRLCLRTTPTPPLLHVQPSSLQGLIGRLDILKSVQMFKADSCRSLSQVLVDGGNETTDNNNLREYYCLPALEKLELISMRSLEHIRFHRMTASVFFPRLHSVTIATCRKLRNLNWILYLPELLHLELRFCSAVEALIEDTDTEHPTNQIEEEHDTFPVLKTLTIQSLVGLTSLCRGRSVSFPALEVLEIRQCPKLSQLSIRPQSKLREIRGGEEWWQRLQWEEPSVHEELLPYFRAQAGNK